MDRVVKSIEQVGSDGQVALWRRLADVGIGIEGVAFGFTDRLARDNGWNSPFAGRVIEEYRRFLFLGQVAGHPVTPSDEVDQAWHLHLTYTRSYWDDLCGTVLGRPFHHGPTRGGSAEGAKFSQWYERTQASYRHWFGEEPPADIWPPASVRFGDAPHFVRVNTRRSWVVTRPRHPARTTSLAVATTLTLAGCSGLGALGLLAQADSATAEDVGGWLGLAALATIGYVVLRFIRRFFRRGRRRLHRLVGGGAHTSHVDDHWSSTGCDGNSGDSGCGGGDSGCGGCGSE